MLEINRKWKKERWLKIGKVERICQVCGTVFTIPMKQKAIKRLFINTQSPEERIRKKHCSHECSKKATVRRHKMKKEIGNFWLDEMIQRYPDAFYDDNSIFSLYHAKEENQKKSYGKTRGRRQ